MGFDALKHYLSLMKYTCKDGLSCTVYVTNEHIVHQFMLLFFFCIDHTPENFKRKQTPVVHTTFLRVIWNDASMFILFFLQLIHKILKTKLCIRWEGTLSMLEYIKIEE